MSFILPKALSGPCETISFQDPSHKHRGHAPGKRYALSPRPCRVQVHSQVAILKSIHLDPQSHKARFKGRTLSPNGDDKGEFQECSGKMIGIYLPKSLSSHYIPTTFLGLSVRGPHYTESFCRYPCRTVLKPKP